MKYEMSVGHPRVYEMSCKYVIKYISGEVRSGDPDLEILHRLKLQL